MKDNFGREIDYLRISLTRRCDLNCSYCGHKKDSEQRELTVSEIALFVRAFAKLGIKKVRLTGGEPLVREDIIKIAETVRSVKGIESLYITTNGTRLSEMAKELKNAGVDGVNISIDTLDNERYKALTGTDKLSQVLDGFYTALNTGFSSVKVNSVLVRGKNDEDAASLIRLAENNFCDVRFIELMPFSRQGDEQRLIVTERELLGRFPFLEPVHDNEKGAARYYTAEGFKGRIGFISPRSCKFCSLCNRIRLLADGRIKLCLGSDETVDVMPYINDGERLTREIENAILRKPASHHFEDGDSFRGLNLIGG
ncbi:MAG: GTP 3',8-cyclase MoaA [Clostridia bacterium]|nr:GTP 3',8-cyclase MoaA [Clostridia bacterium]